MGKGENGHDGMILILQQKPAALPLPLTLMRGIPTLILNTLRVEGRGFRVQGSGFRVQGRGVRVEDWGVLMPAHLPFGFKGLSWTV